MLARNESACLHSSDQASIGFGPLTIRVYSQLDPLASVWDQLEREGTASFYQSFGFIRGWAAQVGRLSGFEPRIVVARAGDRHLFLLPLALRTQSGIKRLTWLADSHTNFRMGLYSREFLAKGVTADIMTAVRSAAEELGVACIDLRDQPVRWNGAENSMLDDSAIASVNPAFALDLSGGFDATLSRINGKKRRKKHRWQLNQLGDGMMPELVRAETAEDADALLDTAFEQMAHRFEQKGIRNPFACAAIRQFFRSQAFCGLKKPEAGFSVFGLKIGGTVRAALAGGVSNGLFSASFISLSDDEFTHISPGELLNWMAISDCAQHGISQFDFGRGDERYKRSWCNTEIEMFDTLIPITPAGKAFVIATGLRNRAKRVVRNNAALWDAANKMRAATARKS